MQEACLVIRVKSLRQTWFLILHAVMTCLDQDLEKLFQNFGPAVARRQVALPGSFMGEGFHLFDATRHRVSSDWSVGLF